MKNFSEAIDIVRNHINSYKKLCEKSNKKIIGDVEAFFRNLIPFGNRYGGKTGYQRAERFMASFDEAIKKNNYTTTQQLLDYVMKYPDKGYKLSDYIWEAVREMAGFTKKHIDFLIPYYQEKNEVYTARYVEYPTPEESRAALEGLVNRAISGYYSPELLDCLGTYLKLDTNACFDYGARLLEYLKLPAESKKVNRVYLEPSI